MYFDEEILDRWKEENKRTIRYEPYGIYFEEHEELKSKMQGFNFR